MKLESALIKWLSKSEMKIQKNHQPIYQKNNFDSVKNK